MSKAEQNIDLVKSLYAAFGRGDVQFILDRMTPDISWEFEAPEAEIPWAGKRKGPQEAAGFFAGIAAEHENPVLSMADFIANDDAVAAFGRYAATVRPTGIRVDSPVGHLFKIRDGKVSHYINLINTAAFVDAKRGVKTASAK